MTIGDIMALPWEVYQTFVIEERHGFNKQVHHCIAVYYSVVTKHPFSPYNLVNQPMVSL